MPTRADVRAAVQADPITPLTELARTLGLDAQRFQIVAHQVAKYDGIDYHAKRLDGRKVRRKVAA